MRSNFTQLNTRIGRDDRRRNSRCRNHLQLMQSMCANQSETQRRHTSACDKTRSPAARSMCGAPPGHHCMSPWGGWSTQVVVHGALRESREIDVSRSRAGGGVRNPPLPRQFAPRNQHTWKRRRVRCARPVDAIRRRYVSLGLAPRTLPYARRSTPKCRSTSRTRRDAGATASPALRSSSCSRSRYRSRPW
jgi:hypothetical protein